MRNMNQELFERLFMRGVRWIGTGIIICVAGAILLAVVLVA